MPTKDTKAGQSAPADIGFIYTIAGTGVADYNGDGGPALDAKLHYPYGVAVDGDGNVYIADEYNYRVRKIDQSGDITTIAGNGVSAFTGDGQATSVPIDPTQLAIAKSGDIFVAGWNNNRVRMIRRNGTIITIAGNGTAGYNGDGGHASAAQLNHPSGIAVDKDKNVYIADRYNHRVRKVRSTDRMISTVAGTGTAGFGGDGHRAAQAQLNYPTGLALDADDNLYIADSSNHRIRKVDRTGNINTIVGTGAPGYNGDGQATSTQLNSPWGIAVDFAGNLFIADQSNHRVRKVIPSGKVSTVAGNGVPGYGGDGDEATAAQLNRPTTVDVDSKGNVYVADYENNRVRKIIGIGGPTQKSKKPQPVSIPKPALVVNGFVNPRAVQQGAPVRVGVYIYNQSSTEVRGEDVTVTVTLPKGFVSTYGTGRRCTRTFPGQTLVAGGPPLDGTFVAIAPRGVRDTTCEAVAEVSYSGVLDATDYTVPVPFSLVKPSAPANEKALTVSQAMVPQARAGQEATAIVELTATQTNQPVNPGTIRQEFSAPANFAFTGEASYAYYLDDGGVRSDPLEIDVVDDGRRLIVNGNPHLNTDQTDTGTLAYVFTVRAEPTAEANEYTDGQAVIGRNDPIPLTGEVLAN